MVDSRPPRRAPNPHSVPKSQLSSSEAGTVVVIWLMVGMKMRVLHTSMQHSNTTSLGQSYAKWVTSYA